MTASHFTSVDLPSTSGPQSDGRQLQETSVREPARPLPSQSGRLDYIDALRGAAAVQVLLSHATLAFFPNIVLASVMSGGVLGYLAATPLLFPLDGASAVCIFFALSGYVLTPLFARSQATGAALILSRFARLGVPAVAGCLLSAVLFQIFSEYNLSAARLLNSQWLAENWRPSADLWFLRDALVDGVLLGFRGDSIAQWFGVPASALPETSNSYLAPLWTLSIEFYGSILVLILARSRSRTFLILASIVFSRGYLICFVAGHAAARFRLGEDKPATPWPVAAAIATAGVLLCMAGHSWTPGPVLSICALTPQIFPPCPSFNPAYLMRIYGATVFTVAVMQCAPARAFLGHQRLRALGRLSFPIYLTHWPIIFGVSCFVFVASAPWLGARGARSVAMIAGVALALVAAVAFERVDQYALRVSRVLREQKTL